MSILIWRGDRLSRSARALKKALRINRLRAFVNRRGGAYSHSRRRDVIVNWGRTDCPRPVGVTVLNDPAYVEGAQCKLSTYRRLEQDGVAIPAYTTDPDVARGWITDGKCRKVLARATTRGSEGRGISIIDGDTQMMPRVPLYVEYVPKKHEYRIHVGRNRNGQYEVLDVQQKRKRREVDNDDVNYQVRNGRHGWVFCRDDITPPSGEAMAQAIAALFALGLDFGAVDLGVTEKDGRVTVYEVNTAPGLEGTTLEVYSDYIMEVIYGETNAKEQATAQDNPRPLP